MPDPLQQQEGEKVGHTHSHCLPHEHDAHGEPQHHSMWCTAPHLQRKDESSARPHFPSM